MTTGPEGIRVGFQEGVQQAPVIFFPRIADRLQADNTSHLDRVIEIVLNGGAVALPFGGVYGLFADADRADAAQRIITIKERPQDKGLIVVPEPEHIGEMADLVKSQINPDNLTGLWKSIHALGVILHAGPDAPEHLVKSRVGGIQTTLAIWTEREEAVRYIVDGLREKGSRALVGTSANKNGAPTHWRYEELHAELKYDLDATVAATPDPNFMYLPQLRRMSTSVVDLTEKGLSRLHRDGNVTQAELGHALYMYGFAPLTARGDAIKVQQREYVERSGSVIAV